jgi:hypothetical protein
MGPEGNGVIGRLGRPIIMDGGQSPMLLITP